MSFGGIFDIDRKEKRLQELETASQNPEVWNRPEEMQKINKEKALVEKSVHDYNNIVTRLGDAEVLMEMSVEEGDEESFLDLKTELAGLDSLIEQLEVKSLLSEPLDGNSTYLSINSGAGGTEACDWASILLRMFTRYAERMGFKHQVLSMTEGDGAGIKSCTLLVEGPFAYGFLKSENGVHRLVRISPFDSNARRHTSFASVSLLPEIDDEIEIEIRSEDLRIDTYRASGAGGQHINRTDSAVRITHLPTNTVVQCQSERSQHANRDRCMKMLKAALYEMEEKKRQEEKEKMAGAKMANEWGSQIRSYVLHPYQMVKDHRTSVEVGKPSDVLDGELQVFIDAYLKWKTLEEKEQDV